MEKLYEFNLDIKETANNTELPEIEFVQGDVGACKLGISLVDNGSTVALTGNTAKMVMDHTGGFQTATGDIVSNAAAGELEYTMKSTDLVPGRTTAYIQIYEGSEVRMTTVPFYMTIKPDPLSATAAEGSNYYYEFQEILNDFAFQGAYSAETTYKKYNIVTYGGSSFIALQDTTGHAPPDPDVAVSDEYWGLKAKKGDPSDIFDRKGIYNAGISYAVYDLVTYGGSAFMCIQACTGVTPEEGEYWFLLVSAGPNEISTGTNTTLTGLIKGDGSKAGVAVRGTDYAKSVTIYKTLTSAGWKGASLSDESPSTDISGGSDNKLKIQVDGDTAEEITLTLVNCDSGTNTAAELQTKIQALGGNKASVTAEYTGARYKITSPDTGLIVITDGDTANVADDLKLGVGNGGQEGVMQTISDAAIYDADCPGDLKVAQSASFTQRQAWSVAEIYVIAQAVESIVTITDGLTPSTDILMEIEVR